MIIDCHGHYTTAPAELQKYRDAQIAGLKDTALPAPDDPKISDDQIRASLEGAQLKLQRERGTDVTIFSPRASAMAHHIGTEKTSLAWTLKSSKSMRQLNLSRTSSWMRATRSDTFTRHLALVSCFFD